MKVKISEKLKCKRCNHQWIPRKEEVIVCPRCKSLSWYRERDKGEKAIVLRKERSNKKLADIDPRIQSLYDKKVSTIIKVQETQKFEEQEAQGKLLEIITQAIIINAKNIQALAEGKKIKENQSCEKLKLKILDLKNCSDGT